MTARAQRVLAAAKINLALVVGPRRGDGFHEVATVLQRIDLCDLLELEPVSGLEVLGFAGDTIVRAALDRLAEAAGIEPCWRVRLDKAIPVGAGLGGGSADAAGALTLANRGLPEPLSRERLHELAAEIGSDVPFFLEPGPKLAEGRGDRLTPLELPQDFWVVVAFHEGAAKHSTAEVYSRFDALGGGLRFEERRRELRTIVASCRRPGDLAALPPNDLAEASGPSPLPELLRRAEAFRADASGAGPAAYGLFHDLRQAEAAAAALPRGVRAWVVAPVW